LYTDQEAPAHLRGTAQGFLTFLTYGVGMFIGSLLSGGALDYFTTNGGGVAKTNWQAFWTSCGLGAFVILLVVAVFFQSQAKVQPKASVG